MHARSNFNKLNYVFNNSLQFFSTGLDYYFSNMHISVKAGNCSNFDRYYIVSTFNYRPCKNCGFYSQCELRLTTYVHTSESKYLGKFNMNMNCKNCEKFINLVTKRNIFSKYVINSEKKFQDYSSKIIDILLCRYTESF